MNRLNHKKKLRRILPWSFAFFFVCACVEHSAAFVNLLQQPRANLVYGSRDKGSRCTTSSRMGWGVCNQGLGGIYGREWSTGGPLGRVRGQCHSDGRHVTGVRSLKAALEMSPITTADIVQFVGKQLQEQSVKHHWQSGFIGGSVGVVGTLTAIQIKINEVRELTSCPYCRSRGQLACATCFGTGSVAIKDTVGSTGEIGTTTLTCPRCRGNTYVTCVNCKGDGREVPLFLNKKASRDPESEIEDVGYA